MLMVPPAVRVFHTTAYGHAPVLRPGRPGRGSSVRTRFPATSSCSEPRRGPLEILFWDRTGCLVYKRLEEGVFHFPSTDTASVEVQAAELALLLEGIDLAGATRHRRYRRAASVAP